MRRLAEHPGRGRTDAARHVRNRSELMDLAIDAALDAGDVTTSDDPDWRRGGRTSCTGLLRAHRPPVGHRADAQPLPRYWCTR